MGLYSNGLFLARVGVLHYKLDLNLFFLCHLVLGYSPWAQRCGVRGGTSWYVCVGGSKLAACGKKRKEALTVRVMQLLGQPLSACLRKFTPQACCPPHPSPGPDKWPAQDACLCLQDLLGPDPTDSIST